MSERVSDPLGGSEVDSLDLRYRRVTEIFAALASPVRAAIIDLLSVEGHTVSALVEALGISQPLASQHLRTLRTAGLVDVERIGRTSVYRLADEHVAHIFLDALQHSRETPE